MQNSTRRNIPYPSLDRSDVPDIPQHISNLISFLDLDTPYYSGTIANRPTFNAAGHRAGEWYYATDTQQLFFNNGAGWVHIGVGTQTQTILTAAGGGTYNTPAGCVAIKVEALGAGGAGGAAQTGSTGGVAAAGSGGNGGDYVMSLIANPASSYAYMIGAGGNGAAQTDGGDTTFGAIVAKGGKVGAGRGVGIAPPFGTGPLGYAAGSSGQIIVHGEQGEAGIGVATNLYWGGAGGRGGGPYGAPGGAKAVGTGGSVAGNGGQLYGGGGGGAGEGPFGGSSTFGGNGAQGLIVVTELY